METVREVVVDATSVENEDEVVEAVRALDGLPVQAVLADLMRVLEGKARVSGSNAQPTISRALI